MKSINKSTLASLYEVSLPTLNKWLGMVPELNLDKKTRVLTPKQLELIFNHLGKPE
ncbi:DUF4248 domain-containing protein [Arcticibacterium luteifluviistationis]|uniref:DUF4248 domain-containing protein n=1 Tax=Arcticibacterium luteifluviistationis TaxID=1784714 RepID=UPI0013A691F2|nr:DUF4248 domain-containing protein [Arcticibacterium luteifluviistationis]